VIKAVSGDLPSSWTCRIREGRVAIQRRLSVHTVVYLRCDLFLPRVASAEPWYTRCMREARSSETGILFRLWRLLAITGL